MATQTVEGTPAQRAHIWRAGVASLALLALVAVLLSSAAPSRGATASDLQQECIQAGLVLPQVKYAYMINPGRKPYASSPRHVGRVQEIRLAAEYPALPEQCADQYRRLGRVKLQIEAQRNRWRNINFWSWIYNRSQEGRGGIELIPTGHESNWYYWKPGERVRAKLGNQVKDLHTGKTVIGKTTTVPVEVRGHRVANHRDRRAASRASVSWTLPHAVSEGTPIPFSWTGSRLGSKHRLVVQRPVGTAHTWQTIMRLPTNSGSGELPGMPLGKYRLRLADLSRHRVLAQQVAGIGVFGPVPFSTLFGYKAENQVYSAPGNTFPYVTQQEFGDANPMFAVRHNHCLSVHVAFVAGHGDGTATLALVQESRDAVSATEPVDTIGSLDAELVPGQSWSVNGSTKSEYLTPTVYINGYAICDSTESFFK